MGRCIYLLGSSSTKKEYQAQPHRKLKHIGARSVTLRKLHVRRLMEKEISPVLHMATMLVVRTDEKQLISFLSSAAYTPILPVCFLRENQKVIGSSAIMITEGIDDAGVPGQGKASGRRSLGGAGSARGAARGLAALRQGPGVAGLGGERSTIAFDTLHRSVVGSVYLSEGASIFRIDAAERPAK